MDYDVVIVGGAPAGLTAAIYAARRKMKALVVSADIGGQAAATNDIQNYPGYLSISGVNLTQKFYNQAIKAGAEVELGEVTGIERTDKGFLVRSNGDEFRGATLILAFGRMPRKLDVRGRRSLQGGACPTVQIVTCPCSRTRR